MAVLMTEPKIQVLDHNGNPLSGGKIYTYAAGTLTPKASYVDSSESAENTNPIILDGAGRASIFISGSYKFIVTDAGDTTLYTADNITAFSAGTVDSTLSDSMFMLFHEHDASKQVRFDLTNISASTTRTITIPDSDISLGVSAGGTHVLLGSYVANNNTSVDIGSGLDLDALIDNAYADYIVTFQDVVPATDSAELYFRSSSDGGLAYDSGSSDYKFANPHVVSGSSITQIADTGTSQVEIARNIGNASGESCSGSIQIHNPLGTHFKKISYRTVTDQSSGQVQCTLGCGARRNTSQINAVRLFMSVGNITSGKFALYGIAE